MHDYLLAALIVGALICCAPVAFGLLVAKWQREWNREP